MPRDDDWLPRWLRNDAIAMIALCGLAMIVGWFPGTEVYRDTHDCFGRALGALFSAHGGGGGTCEPHYVHVRTDRAGSWQLVLALTPVVLGGLALWRWPRLWIAFVWPLVTFSTLVIGFAVTFHIDFFSLEHKVSLWPTYVVSSLLGLAGLLLLALLLAAPVVGFVRWRERVRAARERLPIARVV